MGAGDVPFTRRRLRIPTKNYSTTYTTRSIRLCAVMLQSCGRHSGLCCWVADARSGSRLHQGACLDFNAPNRVSVDVAGDLRAAILVYGVEVVGVSDVRALLPGPDVMVADYAFSVRRQRVASAKRPQCTRLLSGEISRAWREFGPVIGRAEEGALVRPLIPDTE